MKNGMSNTAENLSSEQDVIVPQVGMGATEVVGSDRYAYTIVEVVSSKKFYMVRDITRGALYVRDLNPDAERVLVTLRKDGSWHGGNTLKGAFVHLGIRRTHMDPSF